MRSSPLPPETDRLSGEVVDALLKVHRDVGPGLLEKVYQECLAIELRRRGVSFEREVPLDVTYEGVRIPRAYLADFIVSSRILVELKAVTLLDKNAIAQTVTYLRLSGCQVALLVNFHEALLKDGIRRILPGRGRTSLASGVSAGP